MIDLVTIDEAKAHLGVTFDHDEIYLLATIEAASQMVLDHINGDSDTYATPEDVPANVKRATLLLVGFFDENRAGEGWKEPNMPPAIQALLSTLHTPVLQ